MAVVIGGWVDARQSKIEHEVQEFLRGAEVKYTDIIVPFARCTFCRVRLDLSGNLSASLHYPEARKAQQKVVTALKGLNPVSQAPGSETVPLWVQPHRSPEERARVRALVSATAFCEDLAKRMTHLPQ